MRALAVILGALILTASAAEAHQVFRLIDNGATLSPIPAEPKLDQAPIYTATDCSLYSSPGTDRLYAIPSRFFRSPSLTGAAFGASIESERQDHIVVALIHSIDTERISRCIDDFQSTQATARTVLLYPAQITDVSLLSDPSDHQVLKFHFVPTSPNTLGSDLQILTIVQSSTKSNVRSLKSLLALQLEAVAKLQIQVDLGNGQSEYRFLTVPLDLGNVNLSSQGL